MNRIYKNSFSFFILVFLYFLIFHLAVNSQPLLKGGIRIFVEKGEKIELDLSTPINFYYSQVGDNVAGFIRKDIELGEDSKIPAGSRVEGIITNIKKPKRFGQDGAFELDLTEVITPDGTSIPIYGTVSTDISDTGKKVAEILSYDAALIAYGSFHGFIGGLQYGGIPLAISSHGISLLAGTGIGASAGVLGSVLRKGKIPTVLYGQSVSVVLNTDLNILGELPKIRDQKLEEEFKGFRFYPALKEDEMKLTVKTLKVEHSKVYGDYTVIDFNLQNNSARSISLSDLILTNNLSGENLHPDLFLSNTKVLNLVKPLEEVDASISFLTGDAKSEYFLILVDPLDRKEILRVPLKE